MFYKKVSFTHLDCFYLIQNTVKTVEKGGPVVLKLFGGRLGG